MQIAAYDVDIQHRPGADDANCDTLSRGPVDDSSISNNLLSSPDSSSSSSFRDPAYLLVLDYFSHASLPPPQLSIPISLHNNFTTSSTIASPHSFPSFISFANVHFGDNIHLYDDIRTAQWQDPKPIPLLNYLQNQQFPDDTILQNIRQLASFHRVIDGALYRVFRPSSSFVDDPSSSITFSDHIPSIDHQQFRLVIPKSKMHELLSLAHDHATSAHLGRRKLFFVFLLDFLGHICVVVLKHTSALANYPNSTRLLIKIW
ncbi:unnamed protein product [Rotaria socialis]|uniref:Integrase zinc-binding domain-containing protein n=1 Tax=Rotaria socialis TaxID=392032 RepID=A0A820PG27_9BILA|nr:unnamed protein product [Rotaria socialis]CAF4402526.1 unnamed protein product [Rotaria socialis]CAF4592576.1 unnamed protein product [Rotaria socialis]